MQTRHIYVKIEEIPNYSPVAPDDAEHHKHRLDCMRNMGHEDATIPQAEVDRRTLNALVYREYLDGAYTILKDDPLIAADTNEPRVERRIPGTVIYTQPGERLYVHVLNGDIEPHSLHVHGLHYGIDSDGSWPFGVQEYDGPNRSDAICPGEQWCYIFDAREDTIGCWPFHDHHMHIEEVVKRGLFGGIIVRDPHCEKVDLEVPIFFHRLTANVDIAEAAFDSDTLNPGDTFAHTFNEEGTFEYYCRFHPMQGRVRVTATGPLTATINILDTPARFELDDVTVGVGAEVTWNHAGNQPHTVTERAGAGLESYAINGRTFVGNTPTIVAESGKRIRWYVFNLDMSMVWHNFHLHGQRWRWGTEWVDTRSLGPAESFVADTIVPRVILEPLPLDCCCKPRENGQNGPGHEPEHGAEEEGNQQGGRAQPARLGAANAAGAGAHTHAHPSRFESEASDPSPHSGGQHEHSHEHSGECDSAYPDRQRECKRYQLQGDFLIHCHVEMHMMEGMAAILRAIQEVELSEDEVKRICYQLPNVRMHECPEVGHHPCGADGEDSWELLDPSPIFTVHGALLHTGHVLLFSGAAERNYPLEGRIWDPTTRQIMPSVITLPEDFFCSGHIFLPDGRLLVVGGDTNGAGHTNNRCFIFTPDTTNPDAGAFSATASMAHARWYPTAVSLSDGRVLAFSGGHPIAAEVEVYDGTSWAPVTGVDRTFEELYPGLHLLPSGEIFYTRAGWAGATGTQTAYLTLSGPTSGSWTDYGQEQFYDRQEGMSLLTIDTTASPERTRLYIFGGGVSGPATARNNATAEVIEFSGGVGGSSWRRIADMNFGRTNVNAVVLPTGRILIIGGHSNGQKWSPTPVLPVETYNPDTDEWTPGASLNFPRQYHSVCILLPDGRILAAGGVAPGTADPDQHTLELYSPGYLSLGARPIISTAPPSVTYGTTFSVETPQAANIGSVALIAPISVTHHTDAGQRYIKLPINSRTATTLETAAPANGNIAPPGFYMLFVVNNQGVPSEARFVAIS
ncbi:galactose oxidase-like domain-containing protein [Nitrosovibrio sp. Nv4]|uniref:galactose oxidase-like domain-containing protein n=1 Tax=Nitrosovibrio sp. Nv4 TaxID=1945880 RepID=UPI000BC8E1AE|nr:galactose oxidase-like domain-containing protein [Nitrosovibrio sp. Nv4]SOD42288.1 Multicopper oxidase with three cupredoxin domains (includes cell division protein FtsP and spore coat protein CotA) [Nitrosovibrio sp. Nv4]